MWNKKKGWCSFWTNNSIFDSFEKIVAGNTFECQNCGAKFSNKYDLGEHKQVGHMEVKCNYDECDMMFEHIIQLEEHIKTHHQAMKCQPECDVYSIALGGTSKREKHGTRHGNIHVINNNNVISVVYLLLTQSSMKIMRRHVLKTDIHCDWCKSALADKEYLQSHMPNFHQGACDVCLAWSAGTHGDYGPGKR